MVEIGEDQKADSDQKDIKEGQKDGPPVFFRYKRENDVLKRQVRGRLPPGDGDGFARFLRRSDRRFAAGRAFGRRFSGRGILHGIDPSFMLDHK